MRKATLPVNAFVARNILFGIIKARAPELLQPFISATTGVVIEPPIITVQTIRTFLRNVLNWRVRVATQAGHKLPHDWEIQCEKAFFRLVNAVVRERIHRSLLINVDQTGVIVIPGGGVRTYNDRGARQISLHGKEEKRGFTAVLGIAATGYLLGTQAVWKGKTDASLPAKHLREPVEEELGLCFESNPRNHWSSLDTMKQLVLNSIAPYRDEMIAKHGLEPDAKVILYIDCWKVHKGEPFRTWISTDIPWVSLPFFLL